MKTTVDVEVSTILYTTDAQCKQSHIRKSCHCFVGIELLFYYNCRELDAPSFFLWAPVITDLAWSSTGGSQSTLRLPEVCIKCYKIEFIWPYMEVNDIHRSRN